MSVGSKMRMNKNIFFNILILLVLSPFQNCSSKMQGLSDLTSGATTSLSQSQIPVTLKFTQTPSTSTTETSAQFIFSPTNTGSGIVSTQCSLDGAAYTNCISPLTLLNLSAANHQFSVQAVGFGPPQPIMEQTGYK